MATQPIVNETPTQAAREQRQEAQELDPRVAIFLKRHFSVQWAEPTKASIYDAANNNKARREKNRAKFQSMAEKRRTPTAFARSDDFWLNCDFQYQILQSELALKQVENPANAWNTWAPIQALYTNMNSNEAQHIYKAEDFLVLEKLGEGGYGSVYKAIHIPTGHIVALKEVDSESSDIELKEQRMLPLDCGVVPCYGNFRATTADQEEATGISKPMKTWLVMKYCSNGTLADKVEGGPLKLREAAQIIKHLSKILVYLYNNHGFVHNDIKWPTS